MANLFEILSRGRLQQAKETIEQQRKNANPISQWAQECIVNDTIELDRGPYGVAMRFDLGTRSQPSFSTHRAHRTADTRAHAPQTEWCLA